MFNILLQEHSETTLKILSDMIDRGNNPNNTTKPLYKYQIQNYFKKEIKNSISKIENDDDQKKLFEKFGFSLKSQ